MKELTIDKPIKIHNGLASARYSMNISEQKLFIFAIKNINQNSKGFPESKFNISDFAKYADLDVRNLYKEIDTMTENIMKTLVHVRHSSDPDKWVKYNLTSKCEYDKGNITFRFNNDMKSLLLRLQKHYFLQAPEVLTFRSWYSIRIYDLLKSKMYIDKTVEISLDELKTILDIENKYERFSNLKTRVIDVAVDEINDRSDIVTHCENIFKGRSVHGLRFYTFNKENRQESLMDIDRIKIGAGLENVCFSSQQIEELYEESFLKFRTYRNEDDLLNYMRINFEYTMEKKPSDSIYGYYKKALKNDYAKAIPQVLTGYLIS